MRFCNSDDMRAKLHALIWMLLTAAWLSARAEPPVTACASLDAACQAAAADQSLVLLVFEARWCGPCQILKKNTLDSPDFLDNAGVLKMVTVDTDADPATARRFGVENIPLMVLLSADSKIVARREGALSAAALVAWINQGRERAAHGQWEGAAPGAQLQEILASGTNSAKELVAMLDNPDPADRAAIDKQILARREEAVPPLIAALGHPYLGVRIEASQLLHRLAPDSPAADPWQSPADLAGAIADIKEWWAKSPKLPPPGAARPLDTGARDSIAKAIQAIGADDPVARTEAMSALVSAGEAALPAVREAIKAAERSTDHRSLLPLEDVRWAILISDDLEKSAGKIRGVLARGASTQRQEAVNQLARGGADAIGPLAELAGDSDPLVVENAVRALSKIGGKDTIPAMAALLKAPDSNLRMTAAQALGRTRAREANAPLFTVVDDPDEVVACTAIAGIEEINSDEYHSTSKKALPASITEALKRCLGDSRWRVRSAAVEAIGKIPASILAEDVKALLKDSDGFVVKSALTALQLMGEMPDSATLEDISKRLPSLRAETVGLIMRGDLSGKNAKTVVSIFDSSAPDAQLSILAAMMPERTGSGSQADEPWKSVLARAGASPDARVRRKAAELLLQRPLTQSASMIVSMLADEDAETRIAAAQVVLKLATFKGKKSALTPLPLNRTNSAQCHAALMKHAENATNLFFAAAIYATETNRADLPLLGAAMWSAASAVPPQLMGPLGALLSNLPMPDGKPILEKVMAIPSIFAITVTAVSDSDAGDFLLQPARFRAALERASAADLETIFPVLLGQSQESRALIMEPADAQLQKWSLSISGAQNEAIARALLDSTNASLRALGLHTLGRSRNPSNPSIFLKALSDSNAWVRAEAVKRFAMTAPSRARLEEVLGPLLADTNAPVASACVLALVEPDIATDAGLAGNLDLFEFDAIQSARSIYYSENDSERPLTILETKPAYLAVAKARVAQSKSAEGQLLVLLLAQHGDFSALENWIAKHPASNREGDFDSPILTAIGLSRDAKFLPYISSLVKVTKSQAYLRALLRPLKGMTGPEVRQLRLDINKQMRTSIN